MRLKTTGAVTGGITLSINFYLGLKGNETMKRREAIKAAKNGLKVSGIPGIWNFWLLEDGTLHREYQCGQGAWFLLEKDDSGKIYEIENE